MISFKASKTLGFVLASAGILLNAHSALAADQASGEEPDHLGQRERIGP